MRAYIEANREVLGYALAVLVIAAATFMFNYFNPAAVFWDENYHIASAQKYLEGVMFMEPHPPLGKLFIALGEWIIHPNTGLDTAAFTQTDYIKTFPGGYSWAGMRLFPSLFGMAGGVLFFFILYRIGRHAEFAFLFSSFYLFENGFILQSRSAMLESTQIFFIFATILYFLVLMEREKVRLREYALFGVLMGLTFMVKANGLIVTLLYPALYLYRFDKSVPMLQHAWQFVRNGAVIAAAMAVVTLSVFYIHTALGTKLSNKHYDASPAYMKIIKEGSTANPFNLPVMLRDNFHYMKNYAKGVPRYNPCKEGENGSLAVTWPFINKTINYRWEKREGEVQYLYLMGNPIIWFGVVAAVLLGAVLVLAHYLFGLPVTDRRLFFLTTTFGALYFSYMIAVFNIERVMYLYHYFVPLFFGTMLLFSLFVYLFKPSIDKRSPLLMIAVSLLVAEVIYTFWFFSPFTYYKPISTMEFMQRVWFDFWQLQPVR